MAKQEGGRGMAKRKADRTNDDRAFIERPDQWPRWPWLPLKRKNSELADKNLGVLIANGAKDYTVYHVNLFDLPMPIERFKASPRTTYLTLDALLADGWRVD